MQRTITLLDGKHTLSTPTYYGLQLIDDNGGNEGAMIRRLPAILAALLTDAEPVDDRGRPKRTWDPAAVAKLIPTKQGADELWQAVADLAADALPTPPTEADEPRPTTRPGGRSASKQRAS